MRDTAHLKLSSLVCTYMVGMTLDCEKKLYLMCLLEMCSLLEMIIVNDWR